MGALPRAGPVHAADPAILKHGGLLDEPLLDLCTGCRRRGDLRISHVAYADARPGDAPLDSLSQGTEWGSTGLRSEVGRGPGGGSGRDDISSRSQDFRVLEYEGRNRQTPGNRGWSRGSQAEPAVSRA